ncbi:MAG: iron ABC transporter permease [Candidatus Bipolaricaulota bacterium]|nr:iron ABC transporter permease [Candidatus Bipolaricaulota bacterium]MDW8126510.1 iron ABC transporter permease [Candidatus Bipolaricaulota bacterium]
MRTILGRTERASGRVRQATIVLVLCLIPILILFGSLLLGRLNLGFREVWASLFGGEVRETVRALVLRVRLPRLVAAAVVGANLAVSGAAFQGVFRNPLVESRILGVSAGAGLGAALAMVARAGPAGIQVFSFAGGLLAAALAILLASAFGGGILVLVLSGVLVSSFFSSLVSLVKYFADPYVQLPGITFWLMGGLSAVRWAEVLPLVVVSAVGLGGLFLLRWRLNILTLSEAEAQALGLPVRRLRFLLVTLGTLLTAAAVSVSGVVGWVGLIVPHAARALVGPDHLFLLPASAGLGAAVLLLFDDIARTALPTEIPLDILTGLIGVPVFFALFMRQIRKGAGWR